MQLTCIGRVQALAGKVSTLQRWRNPSRDPHVPNKPKLTPEREQIILDAIVAGNWLVTAANMAGVTARTVRNWLKQAEEAPEANPELVAFAGKYQAALADAENQLVADVRRAAKADARHAQWMLEKRFPKRWGKTAEQKLTLSGTVGIERAQLLAELNQKIDALAATKPDTTAPDDSTEET